MLPPVYFARIPPPVYLPEPVALASTLHFSRYTVRFLMRAGFGGLSSWWQQGIRSGHSIWALTVHVRHPMCVWCKE
jgi:hypothetical protein